MKRFFVSLITGLLSISVIGPAQAAPIGSTLTLTAPTSSLYFAPIELVANVRSSSGAAVAGELVTWNFSGPVTATGASSYTDANGFSRIYVTPVNAPSPATLVITARISTNTSITTSIARTGTFMAPSSSSFDLAVNAPTAIDPGKSTPLTATLKSIYGAPIPGASITWKVSGVGLISNSFGFTDSTGKSSTNALYGSADNGLSTISVTAQIGGIQITKDITITVGNVKNPLVDIYIDILKASNRIKLEVNGADGYFIVLEIDGERTRVEVIGQHYEETFRATKPLHFVRVFVDDELFEERTLIFPEINSTITCRALGRVLTVTGAKPVCPKPFKISSSPMPSSSKVTTCYRVGYTVRMARPLVACPPGYKK